MSLPVRLAVLACIAVACMSARVAGSGSLAFPSKEDDAAYDAIVARFLRAENGVLAGAAADRAREEFQRLPPPAIFALLRGLNGTADLTTTKPARAIAGKLAEVLRRIDEPAVLDFVRDNLGFRPRKPVRRATTDEEEAKFDAVVERFTQYDLGKLGGAPGQAAKAAFEALPETAIFALIRGLNRAARLEQSCPAAVIGKKVAARLKSSNDITLLDYALDNIGTRGADPRHLKIINDVLEACVARRRALAPPPSGLPPSLVRDLKQLCRLRKSEIARGVNAANPQRWLKFTPADRKKSLYPGPKSPGGGR